MVWEYRKLDSCISILWLIIYVRGNSKSLFSVANFLKPVAQCVHVDILLIWKFSVWSISVSSIHISNTAQLIGDQRTKLLSDQCKCYNTKFWNTWLLAIEHQVQTIFLNYLQFSNFLIFTNLIWKSLGISITSTSCPLLVTAFFQNYTACIIMARDNN